MILNTPDVRNVMGICCIANMCRDDVFFFVIYSVYLCINRGLLQHTYSQWNAKFPFAQKGDLCMRHLFKKG